METKQFETFAIKFLFFLLLDCKIKLVYDIASRLYDYYF